MFAYFILFGLSVEFDQAFIDGCRNWIAFLILFPQTIRFVVPLSAPNKRSRPVDSMTNWTEQSDYIPSPNRSSRRVGAHGNDGREMFGVQGIPSPNPIDFASSFTLSSHTNYPLYLISRCR